MPALPPIADDLDAAFTPERLNAMSMAERTSDEVKAFSLRRHNDAARHVLWWLWRRQERGAPMPLEPRQGSMFFLDCGRGPFAITAAHVFDGFLLDRQTHRVRSCQIGNVGFNPEERLIASGTQQGIDIATFRVTPEEIAATGKRIVQGTDGAWPPPPNIGEAIFFGGFPGVERLSIAPHQISFGLHSAMVPLTDSTEYQLCARMDLVSVSTLFGVASHSLFDVLFGAGEDRFPDATEHAVVLTAVKDATRRWCGGPKAGHP
jgi:hypothetical protein